MDASYNDSYCIPATDQEAPSSEFNQEFLFGRGDDAGIRIQTSLVDYTLVGSSRSPSCFSDYYYATTYRALIPEGQPLSDSYSVSRVRQSSWGSCSSTTVEYDYDLSAEEITKLEF